jgi:hypothetical protein
MMSRIFGLAALGAAGLEDQGIIGEQGGGRSGVAPLQGSVEGIDRRCRASGRWSERSSLRRSRRLFVGG